jgi:hypothetical protein
MAGLVPAIHAVTWLLDFRTRTILFAAACAIFCPYDAHADVDGRDNKPGHDGMNLT